MREGHATRAFLFHVVLSCDELSRGVQGLRQSGSVWMLLSRAAGIPAITAQETRAAPQGAERMGPTLRIMMKCSKQAGPRPTSQRMTQGHFSRKMTAGDLVYFGRVDQMMADFIPQNAFRAWSGG